MKSFLTVEEENYLRILQMETEKLGNKWNEVENNSLEEVKRNGQSERRER